MASDALLTIKEIRGESKDTELPGAIHLLTFNWQLEAPMSGTQRRGAVNVGALTITKESDGASVDLMDYLLKNKEISRASVTVRKSGGTALDYYIVELRKAAVKSMVETFAGEKVVETIQIVFQSFTFEYHEQNNRGGSAGPKMTEHSISDNQ
jgi:type VI secretion system secreted protein Hcp